MEIKSSKSDRTSGVQAATSVIISLSVTLVLSFLLIFILLGGGIQVFEQVKGTGESWHLSRWLNKQDVVKSVNLDYKVILSTGNSLTGGIKLSTDTNAADACALIRETIATVNNERDEHFNGGYGLGLNFRWIYHNAVIEDNFDYVFIDPDLPNDPKVNLMHHCDSIEYATFETSSFLSTGI